MVFCIGRHGTCSTVAHKLVEGSLQGISKYLHQYVELHDSQHYSVSGVTVGASPWSLDGCPEQLLAWWPVNPAPAELALATRLRAAWSPMRGAAQGTVQFIPGPSLRCWGHRARIELGRGRKQRSHSQGPFLCFMAARLAS